MQAFDGAHAENHAFAAGRAGTIPGAAAPRVAFIDTEVGAGSGKILDFGAVGDDGGELHGSSLKEFSSFIKRYDYICGHNIAAHDMKYLSETPKEPFCCGSFAVGANVVDTLPLSPLLFPKKPYHHLVKDEKLIGDELNNPLADAKKAKELFYSEAAAWSQLEGCLKNIFHALLHDDVVFAPFFRLMGYAGQAGDLAALIKAAFGGLICENADVAGMARTDPVALAYCLALIHADDAGSLLPRWVIMRHSGASGMMKRLRGTPCLALCPYCARRFDSLAALKRYFGYEGFRSFDGVPLQESAVKASVAGESFLAVFPTGGGKSLTFQVPALMDGENAKELTVVISPLQSLMKDQVDNLEKLSITAAVTINGLLDPLERAEAIRRVEEGDAHMLYISPETLRSPAVERLLLGRSVARFVIDEAHCFSAWGQDFRVDYLYIGKFIKRLQEKAMYGQSIPVSCFTATAKQKVIDDIINYFRDELGLEMKLFAAHPGRKNLSYRVLEVADDAAKYHECRNLLKDRSCPTIIYTTRTKRAMELAERLSEDGFPALPYHGRMESREKTANQDAFISGAVGIMVATSAFGMGVDKKDVGMIIHYDISDSLENYIQEAGRAGRSAEIQAECYVLYNEGDLDKHFVLQNQTKVSKFEIGKIWAAIKGATKFTASVSLSARELAMLAGWDETIRDVETRVKTAVAALEDAGFVRRGQNRNRVFADSLMVRNVSEARDKMDASGLFAGEGVRQDADRIISRLLTERHSVGIDSAKVDELADSLGIGKTDVIDVITRFRKAGVLADAKDLFVRFDAAGGFKKARAALEEFAAAENFLHAHVLGMSGPRSQIYNIKELNGSAQEAGLHFCSPRSIRIILNYWEIKGFIEQKKMPGGRLRIICHISAEDAFEESLQRHDIALAILEYLESLAPETDAAGSPDEGSRQEGVPAKRTLGVEQLVFSILELEAEYNHRSQLLGKTCGTKQVESALLFLGRIGAVHIDGGFLVIYGSLDIERLAERKARYGNEHYKNLEEFYEQKTQMVHIVGEYAMKVVEDYNAALQFVDDYFRLEYNSFLRKYFKGEKGVRIRKNISAKKFQEIFGALSPTQLEIINDRKSPHIVVAAGPGSGKTRVLVHKLASILLMEDIKAEQLLMLTFSRSAATEFKARLIQLIGSPARYVEIKTFHSYCFDILGRLGSVEKSGKVVEEAVSAINAGRVEPFAISKKALVIDEAQDLDEYTYELICALVRHNDGMRVIAVGDDDQNIFSFRGSDSKYLAAIAYKNEGARFVELVENYRSKANLVEFTNTFAGIMSNRMKKTPIMPVSKEEGRLRAVKHTGANLLAAAVEEVASMEISGQTALLTRTNEEAFLAATELNRRGARAELAQSAQNSYRLEDLREMRFFTDALGIGDGGAFIAKESWESAKSSLRVNFAASAALPLVERMLHDYERSGGVAAGYASDFMAFLRDSSEDDFLRPDGAGIYVSTIHKSKGREFDHVVMALDGWRLDSEERKRVLYVGMTRAKSSLAIHYRDVGFFDRLNAAGSASRMDPAARKPVFELDARNYPEFGAVALSLGHKDVFLSHSCNVQSAVEGLFSGAELGVDAEGCFGPRGRRVVKFSKKFRDETLAPLLKIGYKPTRAKVRRIVFWTEDAEGGEGGDEGRARDAAKEVLVLLPDVELERAESAGRPVGGGAFATGQCPVSAT